jgi:foldase protein PrsA
MNTRQLFSVSCLLVVVAVLALGCALGPTRTPGPAAAQPSSPPQAGDPVPTAATPSATATRVSSVDLASNYIQRLPGATLARVNGQEITWDDYEPILREALQVIDNQSPVNWADGAMQQRLKQVQETVLEQAISRVLMRQMAAKQGVQVPEADLEAAVEKEKSLLLSSGQYADWDAFLKDYWLTDRTFRQTISDKLLMDRLLSLQTVETQVPQVHIRHILLSDNAKAQEAVDKLKAGGDYVQLAGEYSEDTQTKDNGGDLGWFTDGGMIPEIWDAVVNLQDGQFSDVVEARGYYFVIQVVERGMRDVEPAVLRQRQQEAMQTQLAAERAASQIEYLVDFASTPAP